MYFSYLPRILHIVASLRSLLPSAHNTTCVAEYKPWNRSASLHIVCLCHEVRKLSGTLKIRYPRDVRWYFRGCIQMFWDAVLCHWFSGEGIGSHWPGDTVSHPEDANPLKQGCEKHTLHNLRYLLGQKWDMVEKVQRQISTLCSYT
jgi:hypothetical protein